MDMYKNTWNYELNKYYRRHWDNETIDKARERLERYYERIAKYITKFKKKELILEHGAYNMNVLGVSLDAEYHLRIVLGEKIRGVDRVYSIDLEEVIDDTTVNIILYTLYRRVFPPRSDLIK